MKKTLLLAALSVMAATGASAQIIINEVYAGGGSAAAGTTYTRDFVELYNKGATPISLDGYSLQYASAAGAFTNTILLFGPGSIIGAGDYASVATGTAGTAGATLTAGTGMGFVNYAAPGGASLSNTGGAVRLFDGTTVIDLIGYGSATTGTSPDPKFETAVAPAPTNTTTSLNRTGFVDTNSNSADFTNGSPTPFAGATSAVFAAAPEPSTYAFIIGGLGVLGLVFRRRSLA